MREILFRAKRFDNGEWVQGDLRQFEVGVYIESYTVDGSKLNYVVDPKTIGQFTGLTDKNGTKIFEGDIIKYFYWYGEDIAVVQYDKRLCRFDIAVNGCHWNLDECETHEIIGNIHDNPELLGGADNEKDT